MRYLGCSGLIVWCVGLWLGHQALAFQRSNSHWAYMQNPMGEDWVICPDGMPEGAVQRIKDGAAAWNYEHFQFSFAPEACLSNTVSPLLNSVNQIDFGSLQSGLLATTVRFFFADAPQQTIECDMRFNSAVRWYAGTDTPTSSQVDWWSVATHEMGHCLGLEHENNVTPLPVMSAALPAGTVRRQLLADDVAGRNAIYSQRLQGVGSAPASPDAPALPISPTASAGTSGGGSAGGGGCSLMPGRPASAASLLAAWGDICLLAVTLVGLRVWSWRRQH